MNITSADSNVLRNRVVEDFVSECLQDTNLSTVAVVGGSEADHEVLEIRKTFPKVSFDYYGIEPGQVHMDLNLPPIERKHYDIVLCTNVIEHIWHHENFAKNLISLIGARGILWCSFPFSDMYHGSPHYYSSGFDPEYVDRLFSRNSLTVEKSRVISSRRLYLFTHLLKDWPSQFRYEHPLVGQILWSAGLRKNPRPPIRHLSPIRLLACLYLATIPKRFHSNPTDGCGAWVKAIRVEIQ